MNNLIKTTKNKISKLEEELDLLRKIVVLSETLEKVSVKSVRKTCKKHTQEKEAGPRNESSSSQRRRKYGSVVGKIRNLLSEGPLTFSEICQKTKIGKNSVSSILCRCFKKVNNDRPIRWES